MKRIIHYIYTLVAIAMLTACADRADEPSLPLGPDGASPLAIRPVAPTESRAVGAPTVLNGAEYDIYMCAVYFGTPTVFGYYTANYQNRPIFEKLYYDNIDELFYVPGYFYPMYNTMELLCYGVAAGKDRGTPSAYPEVITDYRETAEYIQVQLPDNYNGTYDMIAADRISVRCNSSLKIENLPKAHFHHAMSYLQFKFVWDEGVAADADIINRLTINSITIEGLPARGTFRLRDKVKDAEWLDLSEENARVPYITSMQIPYGSNTTPRGIFIIPQENRKRFIISYSIANGPEESTSTTTFNYVVADDATLAWEAGHRYYYTIKIGDSGHFTINQLEVENYTEGFTGLTEIE